MLSGKEGFVKSDNPDLQDYLNEYFNDNEDFMAELYEVITGCISKDLNMPMPIRMQRERRPSSALTAWVWWKSGRKKPMTVVPM